MTRLKSEAAPLTAEMLNRISNAMPNELSGGDVVRVIANTMFHYNLNEEHVPLVMFEVMNIFKTFKAFKAHKAETIDN